MKVVLCHSYYMQRGGEDFCFEEERDQLRTHGHQVYEYVRRNDDMARMSGVRAALTTFWNRQTVRELAALIRRERPDVLHCTNSFPLISPSACHVAHKHGVAVVQALHNYRLMCANACLVRDGQACEDCVGKRLPLAALRHRCYRDSLGATAGVVGMQLVHRALGTWRRKVDAFFTLSEFAREKFIAAGFPAERIHVKCNSVSPEPAVGEGRGGYVAFVARLSPEKGVATVLDAWRRDAHLPPLKIVGDGPLADDVRAAAAKDPRIEWLGRRAIEDVHRLMGAAIVLVAPSIAYETFGRTIAEAFATGTPVVASSHGAMVELVDEGRTGWLVSPGDAGALAAAIHQAQSLPAQTMTTMRDAARAQYLARFTPEANYQRMIEIFELAIAEARWRSPSRSAAALAGGVPVAAGASCH